MGKLSFSFGNLTSDVEKAFRGDLGQMAVNKLGLDLPEDFETKYPNCNFSWSLDNTSLLLESLKAILPSRPLDVTVGTGSE